MFVRLPQPIKDWLKKTAEENMRTQNAELVLALKEKMKRTENEKSGTTA